MKKCFMLVVILCALMVGGCIAQAEDEFTTPPTAAAVEPSGGVESSVPTVELPDVLPYDEYFSEERELINLSIPEPHLSGYVLQDSLYIRLYDGFSIPIVGSWASDIGIPGLGVFYCLDNRTIFFLSETGTEPVLLYESDSNDLTHLTLHYPLLFFAKGKTAMRVFIPDGTVDKLCDVSVDSLEQTPPYDFTMASNVTVAWRVANRDYDSTQPETTENSVWRYRFYNMLAGETQEGFHDIYPGFEYF